MIFSVPLNTTPSSRFPPTKYRFFLNSIDANAADIVIVFVPEV